MLAFCVILYKLSKFENRPMGENSPILVTLCTYVVVI
jgi:hypothetical protein